MVHGTPEVGSSYCTSPIISLLSFLFLLQGQMEVAEPGKSQGLSRQQEKADWSIPGAEGREALLPRAGRPTSSLPWACLGRANTGGNGR